VSGPVAMLVLSALFALSCPARVPVRTGADILVERQLELLIGRRVGLLTNQTGVLSTGASLADTLVALGVRVTALFSPEHGIRGTAPAGEIVQDTVDPGTGIPVHSLYAGTHKPTPAMLHDIDVLLYDLQDVGARCYTYISTMKLAMEAAAEADLPFIVLDRPNPLGGLAMSGPVLEDSLRSFVGALPIPMVYGLTCGELAAMINGERWLAGGTRVALTVVPMEGWRRSMRWDQTGLRWIHPSPNMISPRTAEIYPGMSMFEATCLSEGRGTDEPFQKLGAPFVDAIPVCEDVSSGFARGLRVEPIRFTPASSKFAGRQCAGLRLELLDPDSVDCVMLGMTVLQAFRRAHPDSVKIDTRFLSKLIGSAAAADGLLRGDAPASLSDQWGQGLREYRKKASKYFIYRE
jgi:uncharacterized protein YbbC (DUF1343 family)